MKEKILFIKYLLIILVIMFGKVDLVKAESYNVTVNGVSYVCQSQGKGSGFGWHRAYYPSAEVAKNACVNEQKSVYNPYDKIVSIVNGTCTFRENGELFDCDCDVTNYFNCEQQNPNATPNVPNVTNIYFVDENNNIYDSKKCEGSSSSICTVSMPYYSCSNGNSFGGWSSSGQGCSSGLNPGTIRQFAMTSQNAYWTYYPCCAAPASIPTNKPKATPTTPPKATPQNNNPNSPTPTNNNGNNNNNNNNNNNSTPSASENEYKEYDDPSNIPEPTSPIDNNTPTPTNNDNNNQNNAPQKKSTSSISFPLILLGVLILCLIIIIIVYIKRKKNENESYN